MAQMPLNTARQLYDGGRWKEAIRFLSQFAERPFVPRETVVAMDAIEGWSWYFLAISGFTFGSAKRLEMAREAFVRAWNSAVGKQNKVAVLSGLPLVLWHLDRRIEAWKFSDTGLDGFEDEAPVWHTRATLLAWDGYREPAVEMFEKAYDTGIAAGDLRTAANAKKGLGGLLRQIGKPEDARTAYQAALELYDKLETVGGEANIFHLRETQRELTHLSEPGLLRRLVTLFSGNPKT